VLSLGRLADYINNDNFLDHGNDDITLRICKTEQYVKEKTDYGIRSYLQLYCGWKYHNFITRLSKIYFLRMQLPK